MVTGPEIARLAERMQNVSLTKLKLAALHSHIPSHEWVIAGGTAQENALSLAECAARTGEAAFDSLCEFVGHQSVITNADGAELTDRIVVRFGSLLQEMLDFFDSTSDEEIAAALLAQKEESKNVRRLQKKLSDAEFSESFVKYAKRTRNDLSVIHRKAELLGFHGYTRLQDRVSSVWVHVIERLYPKTEYTPEQQYHRLIDLLYSRCLHQKHRDIDDIDDLLAGIIFDTVANCVIEW